MERFYPLHAFVCDACLLVQLEEFETAERIFTDYAYFSSYSDSWLRHSQAFASEAITRLSLRRNTLVAEAASNDGYLLQYFKNAGLDVLGIEPARNVAASAQAKGLRTESLFLGKETGSALRSRYGPAGLVVANNVIAHVPDLHDFVDGLEQLMGDNGTLSIEFPHLLNLIKFVQFDTIYHEHFSYYSLHSMEDVLGRHGLYVWDVDRLPTHGGSLRVWAKRRGDSVEQPAVSAVRELEKDAGLYQIATYKGFSDRVKGRKRDVLRFLIEAIDRGKSIAAYGAPAKGNTLLNYCGIGTDFIAFTVDRNPVKQGTLLPGSRIPVLAPEKIREHKPDYIFILPWNIREEVVEQTRSARDWGAHYVVAVPELEVF